MAVLPSHVKNLKELMVKNGFINPKVSDQYAFVPEKGEWAKKEGGGVDAGDADIEVAEEVNLGAQNTYIETDYPRPHRRYRLVLEYPNASLEEPYFWMLEHVRQDVGLPYVEKITDTYSSSEQSSFWGATQSRLGIQQDRAGQYLKGISEMIKQLFQLVRELRILDEKLEPRKTWTEYDSADMALKAEYTDLVENRGGQMQPGSIYHLSQSVGYTVLPDMFFNTRIHKLEDVDKKVDEKFKGFNPNVINVLKRKMYAYINWKIKTDAELQSRRDFTLKYLRQHWNTIKMYMNWVKPFLRNIERMQMNPAEMESPDIVGSFETTTMEVEFIAYKAGGGAMPCSLYTFRYRTRPEMSFQKDQYQHKGPLHIGRVEITMRSYGWSKDHIEAYKKLRRQEDFRLLGMVDHSLVDAMEALGEELEKYLSEAGEKEFIEKKKEKEAAEKKKSEAAMKQSMNMLDPFVSIFKGFGDLGSAFTGGYSGKSSGKSGDGGRPSEKEMKGQAKVASKNMFMVYKNFKKSHGLLSW